MAKTKNSKIGLKEAMSIGIGVMLDLNYLMKQEGLKVFH